MNDLYLEHHGIKGQKWGVRRYQNEDGTLTELGKERMSSQSDKINKYYKKAQNYDKGYGYRRRAKNKYKKLIDESDANNYVKQAVSKELETATKSIDDYKKLSESVRESAYSAMLEDTSWVKAYAKKKQDEAYKSEVKWSGKEKAKRYADNEYAKITSFSIDDWDMREMQNDYLYTKMKKEYAEVTKAGKKAVSDAGKYTKKVISSVRSITSQDVSAGKKVVSEYLTDKYKNKVGDAYRFFEN